MQIEFYTTDEILKEFSRRFNSWLLAVNADGQKPAERVCYCYYGGSIAEAKGLSDLTQIYTTKEMIKHISDGD